MTRRKTPPMLAPSYVRPQLDRRERTAARAWCAAAYSGPRHRPVAGTFDPLEMRAGLRANNIMQRAGWVVSNPLYDQTLTRRPQIDPSQPGLGWLREVYRSGYCDLVLLPRTLAKMQTQSLQLPKPTTEQPALAEAPGQQEMFA